MLFRMLIRKPHRDYFRLIYEIVAKAASTQVSTIPTTKLPAPEGAIDDHAYLEARA